MCLTVKHGDLLADSRKCINRRTAKDLIAGPRMTCVHYKNSCLSSCSVVTISTESLTSDAEKVPSHISFKKRNNYVWGWTSQALPLAERARSIQTSISGSWTTLISLQLGNLLTSWWLWRSYRISNSGRRRYPS